MTDRNTSTAGGGTPLHRSFEAHDRSTYYYTSVPALQHPPPARINYARRYTEGQPTDNKRYSDGQVTDNTRVQSSVSSASGSSSFSYRKHQIPTIDSHWPSPTRERTLVNSDQHYPTQWHSSGSARVGHSRHKSEITERPSPPLAHICERRLIEQEQDDDDEDDHAIWVLFWLSLLDPIHSLASCLFTFFVTLALILASPIRLLRKQGSLGDQIIRTLAPIFKNHLEVMYASSVDHAFEWDFRATMLICIQLISPLISIGVAMAAWISAAFWVFACIMGNPDGTERRDDGRDAVLAVRNWWEKCLLTSLRPSSTESMRSIV